MTKLPPFRPCPPRSSRTRGARRALALSLALSLGTALAGAEACGQEAVTAPATNRSLPPQAPIAQRYAKADAFGRDRLGALIDNADIAPRFIADAHGKAQGLLYQTGSSGAHHYIYLDLASLATREIASSASLLAALRHTADKALTLEQARIGALDYDTASGAVTFTALGRRWKIAPGGAATALETPAPSPAPGLVSPDGTMQIIARDYNLYARDIASGREVALTTDGTREQPYGRDLPKLDQILAADSEEPALPVSAQWSPDGRYLLSWRLDTRGVEPLSITQQNPPGRFYPRSFHYIYPLAGAKALPKATRFVIDVRAAMASGAARIVPLAVPREELLYPAAPDENWLTTASGQLVARAQWTERGYGQQTVYYCAPATGACSIAAHEAVKPAITVTSSMIWPAPELGGELAISERSGWAQLYLVPPSDPDGGKPITHGEWEVLSVDATTPAAGDLPRALIVTGVGRERARNPYWRALYRVALDDGAVTPLTPEPLDHETLVSPGGRWIVDQMSSPTSPARAVLREGTAGRIVKELARGDDARLRAAGYTAPEPFEGLAADGKTPIYGMIYRPANFDPQRSYPVIDNVYTGPTTHQVPDTWAGARLAAASSVAQIGAIVVMIDGTGTSWRGQQFRLPAFQNLGEVGIDDHIALIRQMAKTYPYMDTARVGVFGGSAGGYDTARFVLRRPRFFKVGVASSGNHDLRLDKAWWPEVSMGRADEATWARNSNMAVAGQLEGHLLLIHGDIDDNVPVTETFRLAKALIDAGRDVDTVILPNTTHAVYQPFFWKKLRDYFTLYLLGEMPPALPPAAPASSHSNASPAAK
ncbi:prolyl oligopeptidase family serine peptidase [Novosphingobium sp. 1949]|uniref:Prolyl oligopeptidase family serine peptidase n=1 Tax=Novosphingobium organovorum TaxID=2930092 RepID=A0ABT0BEU5_9SPHN|nr:prolyl oligopeptidase family serine peptidase [Novosphingobium organovorum]MCJ2183577.1 prolyl oligopeptidase family serine peptidase [Novosphingobium organovorum]